MNRFAADEANVVATHSDACGGDLHRKLTITEFPRNIDDNIRYSL
jgi:hypothetical protein